MIVKNEEVVLGRILKSVSLATSQIIIMDIGSTDRTKEIARRYTQEVYDFPWKDDLAAARNAACEKASMDYWMWLDTDDTVSPETAKQFVKLEESLDPSTDAVMMRYATGFDSKGRTTFSYYRERVLKNHRGFLWRGRVHEAVTPGGNILYSDIEIQHKKEGTGDRDRNLRIYETMLKEGEKLEPRHQFYYTRKLYYHERFSDAIQVLENSLREPDGWIENKIDTCLHLSYCYDRMGQREHAMMALTKSFVYNIPRAEACCRTGRLRLENGTLQEAVYWYSQALACSPDERSGTFIQKDCYGFLLAIQLCVCHNKLGDPKRVYYHHKKARNLKPDHEAVKQNQAYFERILKH